MPKNINKGYFEYSEYVTPPTYKCGNFSLTVSRFSSIFSKLPYVFKKVIALVFNLPLNFGIPGTKASLE